MYLTEDMERYVSAHTEETLQLIRELCVIPAPEKRENERAEFCRKWFEKHGAKGAYVDEALNVICPYQADEDRPLVVIMAHTDTVFPETEPFTPREKDGKIFCPGVCDDTANLAVVMECAGYFLREQPKTDCGILFVANSGEEGLGDLKGSKQLFRTYGTRIREWISCDGSNLRGATNRAVGSHRHRVTVRTEGGHSFSNFGNRNAIHYLASMIETFYSASVPVIGNSRTTYNVGTIKGGTSVNTIAQEAEMLYEYRSDNLSCLDQMRDLFEKVVAAYRAMGVNVETEKVGDRPCAAEVDEEKENLLCARFSDSVRRVLGEECSFHSGSTDANVPLAHGIPALTMGVCVGGGCHTHEEWLDTASIRPGMRLLMDFLAGYCVS